MTPATFLLRENIRWNSVNKRFKCHSTVNERSLHKGKNASGDCDFLKIYIIKEVT